MKKFWKGVVYAFCIMSLYQDIFFGTGEAYANYVANNWIDRSITIPIALFCLLLICFIKDKGE